MKLNRFIRQIYDENSLILYNPINSVIVSFNSEFIGKDGKIGINKLTKEEIEYLKENYFFATESQIIDKIDELKAQNTNALNIIISMTEKCNLSCDYCYQNGFEKKSSITNRTLDLISNYIDECLMINRFSYVNINYFGGEPLLEKDKILYSYSRIRKICIRHDIPLEIDIDTNGTLLSKEFAEQFDKVNFSVSLTNANDHDLHRKTTNLNGTYELIFQNILNCMPLINNNTMELKIRFNANESNINNFDEFVREFRMRNIKCKFYIAYTDEYEFNSYKNRLGKNQFKKWILDEGLETLIKYEYEITFFPYRGILKNNCIAYTPFSCKFFSDGTISACNWVEFNKRKEIDLEKLVNEPSLINSILPEKKEFLKSDSLCFKCDNFALCNQKIICKDCSCKGLDYQYDIDEFIKKYTNYVSMGKGNFFLFDKYVVEEVSS